MLFRSVADAGSGVVSIVAATRRAMAETPGTDDSVEELRGIWGDLDVSEIHDALLKERARELWGTVRAGANSFLWQWPTSSSEIAP